MIDILLATYNGEKFLAQQLESILNQSYTEWRLIVRDDGSSDQTALILQKYQQKYPGKILIIPSAQPSGNAMNNFFKLLEHAESSYIMFSDQDDVWKRNKIEVTFAKMKEMEGKYGSGTPLLVHTDVCVVDENLKIINPSLFKMQDMDHRRDKLNNLLATNIVTGCTMLFNRPLLTLLAQKPKNAVMHDMWIALVAAAFGRIGFVKETTMLYRQHENNANGAINVNSFGFLKHGFYHMEIVRDSLRLRYRQAEEFLTIYKSKLNRKQIEILEEFSQLRDRNCLYKTYSIFKYDFKKRGYIRILGQIFL